MAFQSDGANNTRGPSGPPPSSGAGAPFAEMHKRAKRAQPGKTHGKTQLEGARLESASTSRLVQLRRVGNVLHVVLSFANGAQLALSATCRDLRDVEAEWMSTQPNRVRERRYSGHTDLAYWSRVPKLPRKLVRMPGTYAHGPTTPATGAPVDKLARDLARLNVRYVTTQPTEWMVAIRPEAHEENKQEWIRLLNLVKEFGMQVCIHMLNTDLALAGCSPSKLRTKFIEIGRRRVRMW